MKVGEAREMLQEELSGRGLQRLRHPYTPKRWCRSITDATPYFAPQVCRIYGRVYILGLIGVYVAEFERLWYQLRRRYCPEAKWDNSCLFNCDLWNLKAFLRPPAITSDSDEAILREREWIDRILAAMDGLPSNLSDLLGDVKQGKIGIYSLTLFGGNFIRRRTFLRWLRENSFDVPDLKADWPPAVISSPTEPILERLKDDRPLKDL